MDTNFQLIGMFTSHFFREHCSGEESIKSYSKEKHCLYPGGRGLGRAKGLATFNRAGTPRLLNISLIQQSGTCPANQVCEFPNRRISFRKCCFCNTFVWNCPFGIVSWVHIHSWHFQVVLPAWKIMQTWAATTGFSLVLVAIIGCCALRLNTHQNDSWM